MDINELDNGDGTVDRDKLVEYVTQLLNPEFGEEANGLIPFNVQRFNAFSLGYHHDMMHEAGLWGFKDIQENIVVEPKFLFMPRVYGDKYIVCVGSGWEHTDDLPEGRIWSKEQKWGVIDSKQNILIPFEYDELECISDDYEELEEGTLFACRTFYEEPEFSQTVEIRNDKNLYLVPKDIYSDIGYYMVKRQLVFYKDRARWADNYSKGYAGVYDFKLGKEIISPNKYREIEIVDYNLFAVSYDIENEDPQTLINEYGDIIGEVDFWHNVNTTIRNEKYKYEGHARNGKYYLFNIKDEQIIDMTEISEEDYMKII